MKLTKTKCKCCGEFFCVKEQKLAIRGYGKVHIDCYKNKLSEKYTEEYVNNKIECLIKEELKKKEKRTLDEEIKNKDKIDKENFENYIKDTYNISLNKMTCIKLAKINNGEYKGLKEGISYEDLLYMFKTKQKYLISVYQQNISKGKPFENKQSLFNYDLAIIINKYDSFKQWKEKQKIIQADVKSKIQQEKENIKIDYKKINATTTNTNEDIDISDILDDIY